ncbi:MAG: type II toxin-antitoxin system HicA family toxin [Stellaceae bacterium]
MYLIHMNSRDVIRALEQAGWKLVRVAGSHHQFKHPDSPWVVTVVHPLKDVPVGTLRSIERRSGVKLR